MLKVHNLWFGPNGVSSNLSGLRRLRGIARFSIRKMISKQRVFEILDGSSKDSASRICELVIISVVVLNVFAVLLDSVPEIHQKYKNFFALFELLSVIFFTVEYSLRVWSYGAKYDENKGGAWKGS